MNRDTEKAERERRVFRAFIEMSRSPIKPESVESRSPPEPDILCFIKDEGYISFELVEICSEDIASKISAIGREEFGFVRGSDSTKSVVQRKLNKKYETKYPIELLCYTSGRTISPDKMIIEQINLSLIMDRGPFRRIWLLGDKCHLVWPSDAKPSVI